MADALANRSSNASYPCHAKLNVMAHSSISRKAVLLIETRTVDSWITPLIAYLKDGALPSDNKAMVKVRARAARYVIINGTHYHRSFLGLYQRCVPLEEAKHIIKQTHEGICGTHIGERSLYYKILTHGLY